MIGSQNVSVHYLFDRQQRTISPTTARFRRSDGETWALTDVSFQIAAGEGAAFGASGSGKSTLLRVIAGVLEPDTGSLRTDGRVGSLLSVQAGVMSLLTGRENTLMLGMLAGMTPRQARSEMSEVKRRSGLGEHYERLVASYSQGMRARLGPRRHRGADDPAARRDPRGAGPRVSRPRRADSQELVATGGIVVATGHDHPMLERLCTRALLLVGGRLICDGQFTQVQREYLGDRRA